MRALILLAGLSLAAPAAELVSVKRIWAEAPHSAFGDIIRFRNQWFAVFREGKTHVANAKVKPDDGKLRVIVSKDAEVWKPAALLEEAGIDLRDPHLSITADGRLMIVAGGSVYRDAVYQGRQPRVAFSKDGKTWTAPQRVGQEGHWLWRVTWHKGRAWGVSKYGAIDRDNPNDPKRADLVSSKNGVDWEKVTELKAEGIDETAVRFLPDDTMVALARSEAGNHHAWIGRAKPPYTEWQWTRTNHQVGGPNFIVLPDGAMFGGGRLYVDPAKRQFRTALARMDAGGYEPVLTLPSGGDNSYPGFVWHQNLLWMMYYSSHEDRTAIYLAKIKL